MLGPSGSGVTRPVNHDQALRCERENPVAQLQAQGCPSNINRRHVDKVPRVEDLVAEPDI